MLSQHAAVSILVCRLCVLSAHTIGAPIQLYNTFKLGFDVFSRFSELISHHSPLQNWCWLNCCVNAEVRQVHSQHTGFLATISNKRNNK